MKEKSRWMTKDTLKYVKDKWETEGKGGKSGIRDLNAVFQQLSCRDKKLQ